MILLMRGVTVVCDKIFMKTASSRHSPYINRTYCVIIAGIGCVEARVRGHGIIRNPPENNLGAPPVPGGRLN